MHFYCFENQSPDFEPVINAIIKVQQPNILSKIAMHNFRYALLTKMGENTVFDYWKKVSLVASKMC